MKSFFQTQRIPFRLVVIVPFVAQIILTVGLTTYISFRSGQRSINQVAAQLRSETNTRIQERLNEYLREARVLTRLNGRSFEGGSLDLANIEDVMSLFYQQLQSFELLSLIYVGLSTGEFMAVSREQGDIIFDYVRPDDSLYLRYLADGRGRPGEQIPSSGLQDYDPRQRPWYITTETAGVPIWSPVYPFYYDVLVAHGRVKIGIGDVTGHGLQSGVLMLMVQTAVRTLLVSDEQDPLRFLVILNRVIYDNIQRMQADKNLTLAFVDYKAGSLRLSGSHEALIIVRADGRLEQISTQELGIPLGLEEDIGRFVKQLELVVDVGDVVVLYTDGVTEANNSQGEFYGLKRLCQQIQAHYQKSAHQIQEAVIADLRQFIGTAEIYDDISLLVMKQRPSAIHQDI